MTDMDSDAPSVFTASPNRAESLEASIAGKDLLIVGLCAAWCNTCDAFRTGFEELAQGRSEATFVWLDIEDDAELAGDIDVENFPTIAVFHRGRLVHFGVSLPQIPVVNRILSSLDAASPTVDGETAVSALPRRLADLRLAQRARAPDCESGG